MTTAAGGQAISTSALVVLKGLPSRTTKVQEPAIQFRRRWKGKDDTLQGEVGRDFDGLAPGLWAALVSRDK